MSIDIAIVGMSGRFPGARTLSDFWQNLAQGKETIATFTQAELVAAGVPSRMVEDSSYVKAAGVLDDVASFDAEFFGYTPREAELMDPQQRLFLETAWAALESAGYCANKFEGNIGVYAGVGSPLYLFRNLASNLGLVKTVGSEQLWMGSGADHLATRVSYKLNLHGPSVTLQTSCSTSLVAVHFACQDLLLGSCDIALAGGVSTGVLVQGGYLFVEGDKLSPDGHCRAFDERARGTVPGSGVGVLVMKRLDDALTDADSIMAVIRGSAVNNDGARKVGYTAPSIEGQSSAIVEALSVAGISAESIGYVETHGTATELGDPIEIAALTKAFQRYSVKKNSCPIGSVKTNIGHADAAAGIAGVIKTVLSLMHRALPPSLHFENPNPKIDFANSPFFVNTTLRSWERGSEPLRAGVSCFGIGGTNAHLVLEEAPARPASPRSARPAYVLPLSAPTNSALETITSNVTDLLQSGPDVELADIAFTLQNGRKEFACRRALVVRTEDVLCRTLNAIESASEGKAGVAPRIAFMFPGGGAQHSSMAFQLYREIPVFRSHFDRCSEIVSRHLPIDLGHLIRSSQRWREDDLRRIPFVFAVLFTVEFSLAHTWISFGVRPDALIGHSLGEYVAACLAGVMSLDDALDLVIYRGNLLETLPAGLMLGVALSRQEMAARLEEGLSLSAVNAPELCVVSGPARDIERLQDRLNREEIESRPLHLSVAAHSSLTEPILEAFLQKLNTLSLNPPRLPFVSNVTGTWISPQEATDRNYWVRHLRQTVMFGPGIETLVSDSDYVLLEVGPGQTLGTCAQQLMGNDSASQVFSSLPHPKKQEPEYTFLLRRVADLWVNGVEIDWEGVQSAERRRRVSLPTFPFKKQRHWVEPLERQGEDELVVQKSDLREWLYAPTWKRSLPLRQPTQEEGQNLLLLADHSGIAMKVTAELNMHGFEVAVVTRGLSFARAEDGTYQINPRNPEHYTRLIAELLDGGRNVDKIVSLWNCGPVPQSPPLGRVIDYSFYALIYLSQALHDRGVSSSIITVSNKGQDVLESEEIVPDRCLQHALCGVISKEFSTIRCRSVDFDIADADLDRNLAYLVEMLQSEISSDSDEAVIAFAGGRRWTPCFENIPAVPPKGPTLRQGGVYLITGGLGGIGIRIAEHLAEKAGAKLVLTGRTASADDPIVQELASRTDVLVCRANVASIEDMRKVLEEARHRFGAIHGVIHAAGVSRGGLIAFRQPDDSPIFEAKIDGLRVLAEIFDAEPIDFMVLFSSLTSVLAPPGLADYSAANAFLDAYAASQANRRNRHTLTIDWELWQGVGMGNLENMPAELRDLHATKANYGISPTEGLKAFDLALDSGLPRVIVSTRNLPALYNLARKQTGDLLELFDQIRRSPIEHTRPGLTNPYLAPRTETERRIAHVWEELLGIDSVGVTDDFFELGGHSLLASRLIGRLKSDLLCNLPFRAIFEAPTVAQLATVIDGEHDGERENAILEETLLDVESLTTDQVQGALRYELRKTNR